MKKKLEQEKAKEELMGTVKEGIKGLAWTMSYTTDSELPLIERLICELRGTNRTMYNHRTLLFWLLIASLVAHALR